MRKNTWHECTAIVNLNDDNVFIVRFHTRVHKKMCKDNNVIIFYVNTSVHMSELF